MEEVRGETWQGPRSCLAELEQLEKEIEDPAKKHKLKKNLKVGKIAPALRNPLFVKGAAAV